MIPASRKHLNRLLQQSGFASLVSLLLLLRLSLYLALSAAFSFLFLALTCVPSILLPTRSRIPLQWPLENSTLQASELQTKWPLGFSSPSQVSCNVLSIFFLCFSIPVTVNMILINMMMAIINMAFEDIKSQAEAYQNKFEIIEYIKRSTKELTGVA